MAEWSKAPDSSSGPLTRAWVQIPLLTKTILFIKIYKSLGPVWLCGCNSYFYILNNFTHIFLLTRNYVPIISVLKVVFDLFFHLHTFCSLYVFWLVTLLHTLFWMATQFHVTIYIKQNKNKNKKIKKEEGLHGVRPCGSVLILF